MSKSSVLVKGMEMPKSCGACRLIKSSWDRAWCPILGECICVPTEYLKRKANCPLVEIKEPHGRLIDTSDDRDGRGRGINENLADEIRKTIESVKDMKTQVGGINNYLSILEGLARADLQKQTEEAYQRGHNDAWETARKIECDEGIDMFTLRDIFRKGDLE